MPTKRRRGCAVDDSHDRIPVILTPPRLLSWTRWAFATSSAETPVPDWLWRLFFCFFLSFFFIFRVCLPFQYIGRAEFRSAPLPEQSSAKFSFSKGQSFRVETLLSIQIEAGKRRKLSEKNFLPLPCRLLLFIILKMLLPQASLHIAYLIDNK